MPFDGGECVSLAGFVYHDDFLKAAEQKNLLTQIGELEFRAEAFRGKPMKRRWAQFGHSYRASGGKVQTAPPFSTP